MRDLINKIKILEESQQLNESSIPILSPEFAKVGSWTRKPGAPWGDMIDDLEDGWSLLIEEAIKQNKKWILYIDFRNFGFAINVNNPKDVRATDGSRIEIDYLSDLEEYAEDFMESVSEAQYGNFEAFDFVDEIPTQGEYEGGMF